MSRRQKLIERIRQRPPEASFGDVRSLLAQFGWEQARTKGSHVTFTKAGENPIVVPVHKQEVGRRYLDTICDRLGLDEQEG